jgi:tetratricopeptide (TPR) repeat protein
MRVAVAAIVALVLLPQAPQTTTDEEILRGLIRQYYDAQTAKDPDKAAAVWSTSANPRMSRESFLAVFGAGDASYTPDVQALTIKGEEARARVSVAVARTIVRNDVPTVVQQTLLTAELWHREGTTWKLVREGPFAEDFADELIAAAPADRVRLMAENPTELNSGLRYVLAQRASMLAGQLHYARAGELFELTLVVARAANDRRAESDTLQNIANAYYFQATTPGAEAPGEAFAKATEYYGQRLTLARTMADEEATAASLLGLATVAYSRGEFTPALGFYREALAIYEKRDEGPSIGRTLVSVGNVQFLQAEYDEAAVSYRRALGLLVTGMDSQGATFARGGLARVFGAQGDLAAALDMYGQILVDARGAAALNPKMKAAPATPLESIGDIHFRLGNIDQARASFDEARRIADRVPALAGRLFGELGLTEIVAGRFDAALANYTESRARYEAGTMPAGVAAAWTGIGFSHAAREKYADAIAAYRTAIRIFEEQNETESAGRAWLGLSIAQSGATDYAAALDSANKVRAIAALVKSEDLAWRGDVRVGDALRQLSRIAEAKQSFQDAIVAIDRLAAEAPTNPEARRQLDDSASAWTGLALILASQGDAPAALAAVEARRAHIRRVQLGGFQRDITRGTTADERADEQSIVRELISVRAQLRAGRSAAHPDAPRVDRLQQQLASLIARREEQQTRLYARLPDLQRWRGLVPAAGDDVNALVPGDRGLLIEYLVTDDEILIVSVAHGETAGDVAATIVPLRRRDFADRVEQAMQPAVLKDVVEWRKKARPIATVLLEPLAARLRERDRVIVVPDDVLWKVPLEALPVGEGDLASQVSVTYATSFATLAAQRRAADTTPEAVHPVAGIAGAPSIPAAIRAQLALTSQTWKEPDAAASLAAAGEIARYYGDAAIVRTAADATEGAVRILLETCDIVHLLAPLQMSGPTPLFSSLLLAGGADAPDNDGRWEAREWFNLKGRARLMVIPDASTFGAAGVGGAMDVLAWAAAAANVSSLVIARWPRDAFTPDAFLAAFHAQLAKGVSVGDAWRAASVTVREKSERAPAGWAGLRLLGDRR